MSERKLPTVLFVAIKNLEFFSIEEEEEDSKYDFKFIPNSTMLLIWKIEVSLYGIVENYSYDEVQSYKVSYRFPSQDTIFFPQAPFMMLGMKSKDS